MDRIDETVGWLRAIVPAAYPAVVKGFLWDNVPINCRSEFCATDDDNEGIWQARFCDLENWISFEGSVFGDRLIYEESIAGQSSVICIMPHAFCRRSFSEEDLIIQNLEPTYREKNWDPVHVDLGATFVCVKTKRAKVEELKVRLCIVLGEEEVLIENTKWIFKKVALPDPSSELHTLPNGVSMHCRVGWMPNKCLTQAFCKVPWIHYTFCKGELSNLMLGFRPFQVVDGILQWRTAPLASNFPGNEEEKKEEEEGNANPDFSPPRGLKPWEGSISEEALDEGILLGMDVMFKHNDGWYHVHPTKFYPPMKRTPKRPYNYEVVFVADNCKA